jgi:hypothetical protein
MGLDASEMLGSRQLAGVRVNPWGAMRRQTARTSGVASGVFVSGRTVVAAGDRIAGKKGAEARERWATLAAATPQFGPVGFLALTANELALMTTKLKQPASTKLEGVVARVPREDVVSVELAGGWPHLAYYILSAAPLTITFKDGSAWQMEVSRFLRHNGKAFVRALRAEPRAPAFDSTIEGAT